MAQENTTENDNAASEGKDTTEKDQGPTINSNDESIKEMKMPTKVIWNNGLRYINNNIYRMGPHLYIITLVRALLNYADCCSKITSVNEREGISRECIAYARS